MNAPQSDFFQPHSELSLNGAVGYRTQQQQVTIDIAEIANNRDAFAISGTLAIELWALDQPYRGGMFSGIALAATEIGELLDQYCLQNCQYRLNFIEPPAGSWQLCLMLREWDGQSYITRDFVNFSVPYVVTAHPVLDRDESGKVIDVDFGGRKAAAEQPVEDKTQPKLETEAKKIIKTVAETSSEKAVKNDTADKQSVSVNNASLEELQQVKGLSKKLAGLIHSSRPYKKLEDLLDLKGMGPKLLKKLQKYLSL